jgi:hypothetical protein
MAFTLLAAASPMATHSARLRPLALRNGMYFPSRKIV